MSRTFSVRLSARTRERLAAQARAAGITPHAMAVRHVEEGTRKLSHPTVRFDDRGEGRRAFIDRWEVWEVVTTMLHCGEDERACAAELGCTVATVWGAVAYYGEYVEEIDELIALYWAERDAARYASVEAEAEALKYAPGRGRLRPAR